MKFNITKVQIIRSIKDIKIKTQGIRFTNITHYRNISLVQPFSTPEDGLISLKYILVPLTCYIFETQCLNVSP
jgi:hypothetical protein